MTLAYPLQWPEGWPRTDSHRRVSDQRFHGRTYGLEIGRTRESLLDELRQLGAKEVVLSTNMPVRQAGLPYANGRLFNKDPGVAAYFTLKKRPLVMARDAYRTVAGNLRSLTMAIEAMRTLKRHGGDMMMERAFTGFAAITPPDWKRPWREVFGVKPDWCGDITALYREKARHRHPDTGGSDTLMAELNVAYEEAVAELHL